ncbi:MAG TPA: RluA family pseudouridine synthase [Candidatus Sulfomarinibacteraceae bacterium]|nr:RluA family pseudouridine synthase [Candidatus Sulfomarinibacteraceae bacterium]
MSRQLELILNAAGERVDKALAEAHSDLSRTQWQQLIQEGLVTIDGQRIKPSLRLEGGERVQATLPEVAETDLLAQQIPLDIIYEDDDMLAINKPAGIVVHPAPGHSQGTLVNAVLGYCPDLEGVGGERRPGIVHRLDKETSGIILVAKNDHALRHLQRQFKRRSVEKRYLALVEGHIQPPEALVDAPIGRDPQHRQRMAVIPPGSSYSSRRAQTEYHLLETCGDFSLVECYPRTGRTHQIRVHLAFAGYPIVGDTVYGRRKQRLDLDRHFLHAASLTFRRPADDHEMTLQAPLSPQLEQVLNQLGCWPRIGR